MSTLSVLIMSKVATLVSMFIEPGFAGLDPGGDDVVHGHQPAALSVFVRAGEPARFDASARGRARHVELVEQLREQQQRAGAWI